MNPESIKTQEGNTAPAERTIPRRMALDGLLIWFIGVGVVIATPFIKRGQPWMLTAVVVIAIGLVILEQFGSLRALSAWDALSKDPQGWVSIGIIALIIAVTSGPSVYGYFLGDDFPYLYYYHVLSWPNVVGTFHTDLAQLLWGVPGDELRPMYGLFFLLNYKLWGLSSFGYHLVSLLLHFANCLLIVQIVNELTQKQTWRGLLAATLFAVMPLNFIIIPWVTGAPAELLPTFFYLGGFLSFMRYRRRASNGYAAVCVLAFAAGLLTKESAVTFPVLLIAYDVWRGIDKSGLENGASGTTRDRGWLEWAWLYALCACLLGGYLLWRRLVLASFLKEQFWTNVWLDESNRQASSTITFFHRIAAFAHYSASIEALHLENLLVPLPQVLAVVAAAIYLFWAVSFWRRNAKGPSLGPILFFGVIWYVITNIPLLVATPGVYHLYLPAVGTCIGLAFLAFPQANENECSPRYVRLLTFGVLVFFFAWQLGTKSSAEPRMGKLAREQRLALQTTILQSPPRSLIILWPGQQYPFMQEIYPHPLEPPFSPEDLRAERNIIADPGLHCPHLEWWGEARAVLNREIGGSGPAQVEVILLTWDDRNSSLLSSAHSVSTQLIRARMNEVLGKSAEASQVTTAEAENLMQALARLASDGR